MAENEIEVVVEIPGGSPNKYEYDHQRHLIRLDRRLFTATAYPVDYIDDLSPHRLDEIEHFFNTYKDLEPRKTAETRGFEGVEPAMAELEACRRRYRERS